MVFKVNIGNDTILYNSFWYEHILNNVGAFQIVIDGAAPYDLSTYTRGTTVNIYRMVGGSWVLDIKGKITSRKGIQGGGLILLGLGIELNLARVDCSAQVWAATASATVFANLINQSSDFSDGTVEAGETVDFKTSINQSLWNAISALREDTNQDINTDYANDEIDILNHKGSSSSITELNEELGEINMRSYWERDPEGLKVKVFGKGDGVNQITGSATDGSYSSGDPIKKIIDPSIITTTEANLRATKELARAKQVIKVYLFIVTDITLNVETGDVLTLYAQSAGVNGDTVRVTKVRRGEKGQKEYLTLQVVNEEYNRAFRGEAAELARIKRTQRDMQAVMQGSGNTLTYPLARNANNSVPLTIIFPLPSTFITDEVGNIRVESFTLDYDVDKYNEQYGSISESNTAPDVNGTSGSTTPSATAGVSVWASLCVSYDIIFSQSLGYAAENIQGSPSYYTSRIMGLFQNYTGSSQNIDRYLQFPSGGAQHSAYSLSNNTVVKYESGESSASNKTGFFKIWDSNYACSLVSGIMQNVYTHTHSSHTHGRGNYAADAHNHSVSIGDGVGEAGSTNATEVNIYLDNYEGKAITNNETAGSNVIIEMADTGNIAVGDVVYFLGNISGNAEWATVSAVTTDVSITCTIATNKSAGDSITWVNKHSVLTTGKTLDTDVDITDSGTYPDAAGLWRVRIFTDNATADLVNAIVKLKHHIDN